MNPVCAAGQGASWPEIQNPTRLISKFEGPREAPATATYISPRLSGIRVRCGMPQNSTTEREAAIHACRASWTCRIGVECHWDTAQLPTAVGDMRRRGSVGAAAVRQASGVAMTTAGSLCRDHFSPRSLRADSLARISPSWVLRRSRLRARSFEERRRKMASS